MAGDESRAFVLNAVVLAGIEDAGVMMDIPVAASLTLCPEYEDFWR